MKRKLLSRTVLISATAFIAMVLIFITTFERDEEKQTPGKSAAVTNKARTAPPAPVSIPEGPNAAVVVTKAEPEVTKPLPPKEVTYEEAEKAFQDKDYDVAVDLFKSYTERKSENPWGFYMLGLSAWKAGAYDTAEASFNRALELDPGHVKTRINLSRVLLDTSRPAEALVKIDEVLEIDPECGTAYRLQGRAYHQLGKIEAAFDAYHRAIAVDTLDAWSMNNLALIQIEQGLFEEALWPLARAIELLGDVAVFHNNLGMALENTGRFRAAEEEYAVAVDLDGRYDKALDNLARINGVLEEPDVVPVDLAALARIFAESVKSWGVANAADASPGIVEPETDTIVLGEIGAAVSEADSTDVDR